MRILLSNDDGIYSQGLRTLNTVLTAAGHQVDIVAPITQQSAVSRRITVFTPLRIQKVTEPDFNGIAVYGTPSDCTRFALGGLLKDKPDLVISGINYGINAGPEIPYSGTIAAAAEATAAGYHSLALSWDMASPHSDFKEVAEHACELISKINWSKLPKTCLINVNYPVGLPSKAKGLKICPLTTNNLPMKYVECRNPFNTPYWWIDGDIPLEEMQAGTDRYLTKSGYIAVAPMKFEFTDQASLAILSEMGLEY